MIMGRTDGPAAGPPRVALLCSLGPRYDDEARRRGYLVRPGGLAGTPASELGEVRAIVVRSGVAVDRDLLDRLPSLRHVVRAGSGVDNIDEQELAARAIDLSLHKAASADAVAEVAATALIGLVRRMPEGAWSLRLGRWTKSDLVGDVLAALRVVVWGAGSVGRACATRLAPLALELRFAAWPSATDVPTVAPDEAIATADIHVLALPLRPSTRHLFDADLIGRAAGARPYLVNVARHDLVDGDAAVAALRGGALRGIHIDAIDASHVPWVAAILAGDPLNLSVSPHVGAQRRDILDALGAWVLDRIDASDVNG